MREFKTAPWGDVVDLDNDNTYSHLPQNTKDLRTEMFAEIGYALCYMDFLHPDWYTNENKQRRRVLFLINYFITNERDNFDSITWYQEQLFLFRDETENMC